jgi:hypothetical protein
MYLRLSLKLTTLLMNKSWPIIFFQDARVIYVDTLK